MGADRQLLQPIKLRASLHETIWGGRNLAAIAGKPVPEGGQVGESWETETGNLALNEPYQGKSLGQLVDELGETLLGWRSIEVFGSRFPLLTKFIDAHDKLSVQVHPDDAYAREHERGNLGKTEAWYILHSEPGAQLILGLERPATVDEVRRAIQETRLEALLHSFPVRPGDVVFVPAGTVHAIGAGIVLYEIQEYSDITYRLYDYGRLQANGQPRQLHVEQSLAVMQYGPALADTVRPVPLPGDDREARRRVLVACRYFVLEEVDLNGRWTAPVPPASCQIVSVLAGWCEVAAEQGPPINLALGETAVLPAAVPTITLGGAHTRVLRSYVPTEDDDLLRRWRAAQPVSM
jgi:mannose-6-phosphate isomerase